MRQPLLLAALLCGVPLLGAAEPAPHPIVGSWAWTLPGKQCSETLKYRGDGTRSGSSGEEVTQARYDISTMPSLLGFYRLAETISESNGKRDCSGDLHEASAEPAVRFIQFSPKRDQFIVCEEEELRACFGPLKRVNE